jgi:hypothetical protein
LTLRPKPSRALTVWWLALHALLAAAALLVASPWPVDLVMLLAIAGHGVVRRPRPSPKLILVSADGRCAVPDREATYFALGARTVVCPHWVRLDFGTGPRRRDILLVADQLDRVEWVRLRALLERTRRG